MLGVIIKNAGVAIEKRQLAGNDARNMAMTVREQNQNPDKEYIVYDLTKDDDKLAFEKYNVANPNIVAWEKLRGSATEVDKIFARMLGLER